MRPSTVHWWVVLMGMSKPGPSEFAVGVVNKMCEPRTMVNKREGRSGTLCPFELQLVPAPGVGWGMRVSQRSVTACPTPHIILR